MKNQEKILQDELKDKKERWINIQLINSGFNKYQKNSKEHERCKQGIKENARHVIKRGK